jgi:hypothetical protein
MAVSRPRPSSVQSDIRYVAAEAILAGEPVRLSSGGAQKACGVWSIGRLNPIGFSVSGAGVGDTFSVRISGVSDVPVANFDPAPTLTDIGQRVWLSTTATGMVTMTAPSLEGSVVQRLGILATLNGGAGGSPQVVIQIGDYIRL